MRPRSGRLIGLLCVVTAVLLFGLSLSVIKWPRVSGSVIAWWRLLVSAALWWLVLLVLRVAKNRPLPSARAWCTSTIAALPFGINISLAFLALTRTSVVHADLIGAMSPLVLIPAAFVLFGERPHWRALAWGALSVAGLVIVLTNGPVRGVATVGGDVLAALGALAFCAYQLAARRARRAGVSPIDFLAITMPVALVTATPVALLSGNASLWPLSGKAWVAVILLAVFTGMIGHGLLYVAQQHVPLGTISVIQTSQPAQSAMWAWVLLGESMTAAQLPGLAMVLIGMALVVVTASRLRDTR